MAIIALAAPLAVLFAAWFLIFVPPPVADLRYEQVALLDDAECRQYELCRPGELVLRIDVSTRIDLKERADRYELNLWSQSGICPRIDRYHRNELDQFGPYWKGRRLPVQGDLADYAAYDEGARPGADGRWRYEVYLYALRPEPDYSMGGNFSPPYDLRRPSRDICLVLGGGNMGGGRFMTNKVIIPKDDIEEALASSTRPSPPGPQARVSTDPPEPSVSPEA